MGATSSALRAAVPALKQQLFNPIVALICAAAFLLGLLLPYFLKVFFPESSVIPHTAMAASFFIDLAGIAVLLSWLPSIERHDQPWLRTSAWIGTCMMGACAFAGLALAGTHQEPARTFVTLWILFAAQAAAVTAVHALLWMLLYDAPQIAAQSTWLLLAVTATALFWSREPIQMLTHAAKDQPANATRAADAVMNLSPPMALAAAWYQESDAARTRGRNDYRFDLIRAQLSYEVWIGSYQALPYPEVTPSMKQDPQGERPAALSPGLILAMLAWGLPLIILSDVLLWWRGHSCPRVPGSAPTRVSAPPL